MKGIRKIFGVALLTTILIWLPGRVYADNIEAKLPTNDGSDAFQVQDSTGMALIHVQSDGNVGIGTPSPMSLRGVNLEISGANTAIGDAALELTSTGTGISTLRMRNDTADWHINLNDTVAGDDALDFYNFTVGQSVMVLQPDGNVGIGTMNPSEKLEVRGSIKLGTSGEFYAHGGVEELKTVRGTINTNGSIAAGSGFTCNRTGSGQYTVTFAIPFYSSPSLLVSARSSSPPGDPADWFSVANVQSASPSSFTVRTRVQQGGTTYDLMDEVWDFIAIGPK